MLHSADALRGATVHALDGDIGEVKDLYFDDEGWTIRYVIVETGSWLNARRVLLSIVSLASPDLEGRRLPVRLTREQVKNSPDVNTERPVSREQEVAVMGYYNYPYYWAGPALWGPAPAPGLVADMAPVQMPLPRHPVAATENHLRSCREVIGYHVEARDGEIGHIDDFLIDPATWAIERIRLDTSNWIGGRAAFISPGAVADISWSERLVHVSMTREEVKNSPTDPVAAFDARRGADGR